MQCQFKMRSTAVILVALATIALVQSTTTYEGYKVYTVLPTTSSHLTYIKRLENDPHFDFWSKGRHLNQHFDIMVSTEAQKLFEEQLQNHGMQYSITIDNVERIINNERSVQAKARTLTRGLNLTERYYRHEEINDYLRELAEDYPNLVQLQSIGTSLEGRELIFAKVSSNPNASNPVILIDGGIHAREWIAPATVLYILQQLLEENNSDLISGVDWYLLPVLNPDGYEFTHTTTRLWRKTRSRGALCFGTDANRNFDYFWGTVGASASECAETYRGPVARSEIETRLFETFARQYANRTVLYLSFHSYGQYLLYPWGYINSAPANGDELQAVGDAAADAIYSTGNVSQYTVGVSSTTLYATSGSSVDWIYGALDVPLSYTVELPSRGYGFLLPIEYVEQVILETFAGVRVFGNYVNSSSYAQAIRNRQ